MLAQASTSVWLLVNQASGRLRVPATGSVILGSTVETVTTGKFD
jgi:hypothetical protein